jgi:vitamin B12/bleomycin/antimicrobial peptide transport system ATP-binding/permease protein
MHGHGQEQKAELGNRQYLLRRFCASAFGYWRVGGERSAWLLTSGLFCLILLNLGVSYELNVWNRTIFDALQQRDSGTVALQGIIYFPLMAISVPHGSRRVYRSSPDRSRWSAAYSWRGHRRHDKVWLPEHSRWTECTRKRNPR